MRFLRSIGLKRMLPLSSSSLPLLLSSSLLCLPKGAFMRARVRVCSGTRAAADIFGLFG
jgi:hypothetical protein